MQRTVLATVQEFCRRTGLTPPANVMTNTDDTIQNILGLLRESCEDLVFQHPWKELEGELKFNHQGSGTNYLAWAFPITRKLISGVVTSDMLSNYGDPYLPGGATAGQWGMQGMVFGTLYDLTNQQLVRGPLSRAEWQAMTAAGTSPTLYSWMLGSPATDTNNVTGVKSNDPDTLSGIMIYPIPSPVTSVLFSVEYRTMWYAASVGSGGYGTPRQDFSDDSDWCLLPSQLVLAWLKWKWKQSKGFPYMEEQRIAVDAVSTYIGRLGGVDRISMDGCDKDAKPGIVVPAGSWDLP